jgi:serine/threonine-protein kinase
MDAGEPADPTTQRPSVEGTAGPTRVAKPVRPVAPPAEVVPTITAAPSLTSAPSLIASPIDTLLLDEMQRTRKMTLAIVGLIGSVALLTPLFGGDPIARGLLIVGLLLALAACGLLLWLTADRARFTTPLLAVAWMACALGVTSGILYFGIFSPAPVVFVLGLYFVGLGSSAGIALGTMTTAISFMVVVGALVVGDVVADPGIITADHLRPIEQAAIVALVVVVFAASVWVARMSRRTMLDSVVEHERAVRAAAHREALLQEARAELERALRLGEAGRFTDQVLGSFRLGPVIGRGAMGEVYEAVHTGTGEVAAVKLLRRDAIAPGIVHRFLREARAASALQVPNVVRVLEFGDDTAPLPYIAMELLRGQDLARLLRARPRLPAAELADMIAALARGVDAAGAAGIVHRDLKPQNVFRHDDSGGTVWKILDFGVSKLRDHAGTLTGNAAVGTPAYMAPEQAQGREVDTRADVHALAVIAFRGLTGELPYRGSDPATILYQVVHATPPPASSIAPLPRAVDAVLARGLAKDPAQRYPTAGAFAEALQTALRAA